jgi:putative ATP-binding cassette transporter
MTNNNGAERKSSPRRQKSINGIFSQLEALFDAFRVSRERVALRWLGAALIVVISLTAFGQIKLNAWNRPFFDALERKDVSTLLAQTGVFLLIASVLLALNVAQMWLSQMTKLKLREGLTRDLFSQWLKPKRPCRLAHAGVIGINPDQRIHADAQRLAEASTDLGIGLLQASMLLISFVGVLWSLSSGVSVSVFGRPLPLPGYMVWAALLYAGAGWYASFRIGAPLVRLGAERYARESELRSALMNVNEHGEAIAISRGESEAEERLRKEFERLSRVLHRLARATTRLTWVTAGYGWLAIIVPIVVAAPAYFFGNLTFGGLLMAVGAFTQVQQSLRWFVDNAGAIADWRATLFRVGSFRRALQGFDEIDKTEAGVRIIETGDDRLIISNLVVKTSSASIGLDARRIEIAPGDRVLILGEPRSGKTLLFHTLAAVRRAGSGEIRLPPDESVVFMPRRPFLPELPLRNVLAYPRAPGSHSDAAYLAALNRMGLKRLATQLDRVARWDRELLDPEQQALAFARLLLRRPRFVVMDEAIETLSPQQRLTLVDLFENELAGAAVVSISGQTAPYKLFSRVYRITDASNARPLDTLKGAPPKPGKVAARSDL